MIRIQREAVPEMLMKPIIEWACVRVARGEGQLITPQRRFLRLLGRTDVPVELEAVKRLVLPTFDVDPGAPPAPKLGHFIGYQVAGGFTHPHRDPDPSTVRVNVMLMKPIAGGNPVIAEREYPVLTGDAWFVNVGRHIHESRPVQGERARIVLSFGYVNEGKPC